MKDNVNSNLLSLAVLMSPSSLSECLGQKHLIGENKILSNLVKNKKLFSMILYGKPGIGKTSIAYAIVSELKIRHRFLNAVINSKADFEVVVEEASMSKISYVGSFRNHNSIFKLFSSGKSMGESSLITIEDGQYTMSIVGLDIAVYDLTTYKVIDRVAFQGDKLIR